MEQIIVGAVALVAVGWWASAAPWRRAVAVQRQVIRVGRSRIK